MIELSFNSYDARHDHGAAAPSTKALQDPAFRDALGYAIDKQELCSTVLGGYGDVGHDPCVPAVGSGAVAHRADDARTFDIDVASQKLDAAGYR